MMHSTSAPTERDDEAVVRRVLGVGVRSVTRFPAGLCHYVYDVVADDSRRVVARRAGPGTRDILAGSLRLPPRSRSRARVVADAPRPAAPRR